MIDKDSATPIYLQLKELLIADLGAGKYQGGDKFPSENQLAGTYKMNRLTVRRALLELEEENYIYSVHGKGRFVGQQEKKAPEPVNNARPLQVSQGTVGICGYFETKHCSFYGDYLTRLVKLLTENGYQIRFLNNYQIENIIASNSTTECDLRFLIFIAPTQDDVTILKKVKQQNIDVIVVNRVIDEPDIPNITIDQYLPSQQLASALLDMGHQDIGVISAVRRLPYAAERMRGVEDAFKLKGKTFNQSYLFEVDDAKADFSNELKQFFSNHSGVTAVYIAGETLQPGVFSVLAELKKKIPDELSVAAFGEIILPENIPPITHSKQPMEEMAEQTLVFLKELCQGRQAGNACLQPVFIRANSIKKL